MIQLNLFKNKHIFSGLGCFPDVFILKIKNEAIPEACPSRRVPLKIKS